MCKKLIHCYDFLLALWHHRSNVSEGMLLVTTLKEDKVERVVLQWNYVGHASSVSLIVKIGSNLQEKNSAEIILFYFFMGKIISNNLYVITLFPSSSVECGDF